MSNFSFLKTELFYKRMENLFQIIFEKLTLKEATKLDKQLNK
jgi:hypothetical protein